MFGSNASSGGGLFGSTANNNSGGGLFGASKPSGFGSAPAAGGPTAPGAPSGGGLFGGSTQNLFGGSMNQPTAPQGQQGTGFGNNTAQSGGLFGAKPAQPAPTTGLFGGASTTGQGNTSGGLFGGNASNSSNTSNTNSGGLFNKPAGQTGGLFGQQSGQNSQSGGLFGGSTSNNGQSGGLFGSSTSNNTQSGGLFGQQNNQTAQPSAPTGGLFGGSSSGGLFGQQQQQQQQQPGQQQSGQLQGTGGLFGNKISNTAQPSFAWSSQQQPATNNTAFGNNNNTNTNNNVNTNNNNFFQQTTNTNNANNTNNNTSYTPAINDQLLKIKEQWDPNSPKCALKTHLYNKLSEQEAQIAFQQRPANEQPEDWDLAMSSRPSPQYYPLKITSFTEVAQRIEVQLDHVAKARVILKEMDEKQSQISSKHDLNNTTRILKAKSKHVTLLRRLLRLATVLAILKLKGYPLLPEEEEISRQFELLNKKLSDPSSPLGKMNDVFAKLAILKDRLDDLAYQFDSNVKSLSGVEESSKGGDVEEKEGGPSNEETIQKLSKLLLKLQIGLNHLNGVLEKDLEVADRVR